MADLGSKSTDGRLSFVKYVTENVRFSEIEFEIEKGKSTNIYTKKGGGLVSGIKQFKEGTKIKITDKKLYKIDSMKMAAVQIGPLRGLIPINVIRKPTGGNGTQYEDEVVDAINAYILNSGGKIDIKLKGDSKTYKDIAYAIKVDSAIKFKAGVKGDPKADIILCKDNKNPTIAGSIYVSHKKKGGPEVFQQYGGLSEQSGERIYNNPLVQKFLAEVSKLIGNKTQLENPVIGEFEDDTLSNMSIYGPDYGKAYSLQHAQIIGQGNPIFNMRGSISELSFSSNMSLSGNLSHFRGGYLPVFGATFRAGRGFTYKNKRYNGARVAIYPYKLMATRSGLIFLKIKK